LGNLETVVIARDRCEATRYGSLLEELGIPAVVGHPCPQEPLGVPIFVSAEELDRAGEILATFQPSCAWDEEDDEFEDDDDDEEEEEEDFLPDDADDDFEEEEKEKDEDEDGDEEFE
jgi:hypothetical protein